jgi:hypothetical protein
MEEQEMFEQKLHHPPRQARDLGRFSRPARMIGTICGALVVFAFLPIAAFAGETYAFDPVLSLTGNCEVEEADPVADPGLCPIPPGVPYTSGSTEADHPSARFDSPAGIATDFWGDIYVASAGPESTLGSQGRIDVFDSGGNFITEIKDPSGPGAMAVDSEGHLYVANRFSENQENIVRYDPAVYKPAEGLIEYKETPTVIVPQGGSGIMGLAVDPMNDHLVVKFSNEIEFFKAAAELNEPIEAISQFFRDAAGIAVDAAHGRLYASDAAEGHVIRVFKLDAPHDLLFTIKGSAVPSGSFVSTLLSLAVDEATGHLFVFDGAVRRVYEFDPSGAYVGAIEHSFGYVSGSEIAVDNGEFSPNGSLNPEGRYLFVPSGTNRGHSYAFGPQSFCEPKVESIAFGGVAEQEAELRASIEPCGLSTHYTFEYTTQQTWESEGFSGAQTAGAGDIPAGRRPVDVTAAATGLEPGTAYRFRVIATNTEGSDEAAGEFATFAAAEPSPGCPNDLRRTGLSALLPDCRAYELVTPPSTNGRAPRGTNGTLGTFFASRDASPGGDKVSFEIEGGAVPGIEATGSLAGDPYVSSRGAAGWTTSSAGPNGLEAPTMEPGSFSPDQGYNFWSEDAATGSAAVEGGRANYVRYPDGHSALVGRGSLAVDPFARGRLISAGGEHIVFLSPNFAEGTFIHPAVQLEPDAPPTGTTIYDRTADEVTHVVSLLPGNKTPAGGGDAVYQGASLDGKGIAFTIGGTLYLRFDNKETYEVGENVTFAGVAEGGARIFYLEGGNLEALDAVSGETIAFSTSGDVTPVNVAADGTVAYFVSPSVLTSLRNPNGVKPVKAKNNLYRSQEGAISFVGTVTERDVEGEELVNGPIGGLGLWVAAIGPAEAPPGHIAIDPSRTTSSGDVLLFESRARLDGYDPKGHGEVYRYDFTGGELRCLSCNPTLAPAVSDANLQEVGEQLGGPVPLSKYSHLTNLSSDGRRAFFQSMEALVPGDTDGLQDVYEWEAQGKGSCGRSGGCVYLISSGNSARTDQLYAVSETGDDVFFRTSDRVLSSDLEDTPSIYDARAGGGFSAPAEPRAECLGEACQPAAAPPEPQALGSSVLEGAGNVPPRAHRPCPKGKRMVRRQGKVRCVKKHRRHHHRKAGSGEKGGHK